MDDLERKSRALTRVQTGIQGLDVLLNGGVLRGGVYLLMGPPGSGKTIIANQMSFHHIAQGHSVLYVTLLAESHTRMIEHLRELKFFDEKVVTQSMNYIGGYQVLEKEGLGGLLKLLHDSVRKFNATPRNFYY